MGMPKKIDYTLNQEQLQQVREGLKSPVASVAQRASVLHSLHLGYSVQAIAQMQDVSVASVYNYVTRFQEEGLEGLANKPIPGRPRKATPQYIELLEATLEIDPKQLGYAFTVWTQARLRRYLAQQTGIEISRARFQELLQSLHYHYRRPKRDLGHKQDPQLREQVKAALQELKKVPNKAQSSYSLWTKHKSD